MTNEDCINKLKYLKSMMVTEGIKETIDMAIKALEFDLDKHDEPNKPYICEADWNCKDCPNWVEGEGDTDG